MKQRLHGTIAVLGGLALAASAHLADAAGLAVPTGVAAHPPSPGHMRVFWNAAAGATSYNVYRSTLYFVEHFWSAAGKRLFDVIINGNQVLTDLDVFADAGGQFIAVQHAFTTTASSSGEVVVQFVAGTDNPIVNAIVVD
jgi:hypothetical protein